MIQGYVDFLFHLRFLVFGSWLGFWVPRSWFVLGRLRKYYSWVDRTSGTTLLVRSRTVKKILYVQEVNNCAENICNTEIKTIIRLAGQIIFPPWSDDKIILLKISNNSRLYALNRN